MSLSRAEKERIIRALEEDREFRYALMGLLGFKELLERFARLEERQQRLEERQQRLEERFARLEERQQRLEERQQRLEERQQRLEERFARLEERQLRLEERQQRLEERQQRLEERFARLEERQLRLEERQQRLEEEMRETRRILAVIAHRFGILSEAGLREALKYVVQDVLGVASVERKAIKDDEGVVYGHPAMVEIDVVVRDREHILVEVKSRVSRGDVAELYRIGSVYEKLYKVKPRLLIIGGFIDADAIESAARLNVEVRPAVKLD